MSLTLDQKIAAKEAEIARLKNQARKLETGQKIIIGGMMLAKAKKDSGIAKQLIADLKENVTSATDKKRIEPVIDSLQKQVNEADRKHQPHIQNN